MARPDRYDYIGLGLLALVAAMWIAHLVLPAAPPDPSRQEIGNVPALPAIAPPR